MSFSVHLSHPFPPADREYPRSVLTNVSGRKGANRHLYPSGQRIATQRPGILLRGFVLEISFRSVTGTEWAVPCSRIGGLRFLRGNNFRIPARTSSSIYLRAPTIYSWPHGRNHSYTSSGTHGISSDSLRLFRPCRAPGPSSQ